MDLYFSSLHYFHFSRNYLFVNGFIAAPFNPIFGGTKCCEKVLFWLSYFGTTPSVDSVCVM